MRPVFFTARFRRLVLRRLVGQFGIDISRTADNAPEANHDRIHVVDDFLQRGLLVRILSHQFIAQIERVDGLGKGVEGVVRNGPERLHGEGRFPVAHLGCPFLIDGMEGIVRLGDVIGGGFEADSRQRRAIWLLAEARGGIGEQGGFGGVILPRGASRLVKHMFSRLASLAFLRVGAIRGVGINNLVVKEECIVAERVGLDDFRREVREAAGGVLSVL